jgi:homoserine kinase
MSRQQVTVQVPATTANMGPAFDCMGMALDIWNRVRLEVSSEPAVGVRGQGDGQLPLDESNLVYRAAARLFDEVGKGPVFLSLDCDNQIPLARGLGSSAAAIVGGLVAANHLAGQPLSTDDVLSLAVEMEGHPDNVAPALLGGIRLVARNESGLVAAPVRIPQGLKAVLYVPEGAISTAQARAALPQRVTMEDAVYNIGRVALLVNSLAGARLEDLRLGTEDRLHQPYRAHLFPAMAIIIREALNGGALGAFVSGSGPTVLALTRGREMSIAYEMAEAARKTNTPGKAIITSPSTMGAHLLEEGARS